MDAGMWVTMPCHGSGVAYRRPISIDCRIGRMHSRCPPLLGCKVTASLWPASGGTPRASAGAVGRNRLLCRLAETPVKRGGSTRNIGCMRYRMAMAADRVPAALWARICC